MNSTLLGPPGCAATTGGDVPDGLDVRDDTGEGLDTSDIEGLARFLLARLGMADDAELSITLVDEHAMAELHVEWMDEPGSTDVLSFPWMSFVSRPRSAAGVGGTGDVVVCPAVARRQSRRGWARRDSRGADPGGSRVLHLLGHDHVDPAEERVMFERQQALVAEYAQGPVAVTTTTIWLLGWWSCWCSSRGSSSPPRPRSPPCPGCDCRRCPRRANRRAERLVPMAEDPTRYVNVLLLLHSALTLTALSVLYLALASWFPDGGLGPDRDRHHGGGGLRRAGRLGPDGGATASLNGWPARPRSRPNCWRGCSRRCRPH